MYKKISIQFRNKILKSTWDDTEERKKKSRMLEKERSGEKNKEEREKINRNLDQSSMNLHLIIKYSILTGGRLSFETTLSSCEVGRPDSYAAINGWSTM